MFNGETVVNNAVLENFFANRKAGYQAYGKVAPKKEDAKAPNGWMVDPAFAQRPDPAPNTRQRDPLEECVHVAKSPRRSQSGTREARRRRLHRVRQRQGSEQLAGRGGELRSRGRRHHLQARQRRRSADQGRVRERHHPCGIQAAEGRQQRHRLRTPLGGHSASDGLELQVIDSDGYNEKQAAAGKPGLKPEQYHGSLYHCVGAKHGYLRPVGEWNFQEIEINGQKIKVTLNGTKILDVDINTFDRSQIAHPPKGLDHTKGYIGFAGHSDPVVFRSFRVKQK
jgi:hypothetical protein